MALTLLKTVSKVAIGGVAVYATVDYGIWSNSYQASAALDDFKNIISPTTEEYWQKNPVPKGTNVKTTIIDSWNSGVKTAFTYLYNAPETACSYIKQGMDSLTSK